MKDWKSFFIGAAVGLLAGFLLFSTLGNRYEISTTGINNIYTIKLDKWTGKSWMQRYYTDKRNATTFYWGEIKNR